VGLAGLAGIPGLSGIVPGVVAPPGPQLVTDSLGAGVDWVPNIGYDTLINATSFTMRMDLSHVDGATGLIWEAGGSTIGSIGYANPGNILVLKAGGTSTIRADTLGSNAANRRIETPLLTGTHTYEWSFASGNARSWTNGVENIHEPHSWAAPTLAGISWGGLLDSYNTTGESNSPLGERPGMDPGVPDSLTAGTILLFRVWRNIFIS
jgi:hypothetical protein